MRKTWLATGLMTLVAAGLMLGQASFAHAADPAQRSTLNAQRQLAVDTPAAPATSTDPSSQAAPNAVATDPSASQLPNDSLTIKASCPSGIGPLAWIACPLINSATNAISSMAHLIVDLLKIRPLTQDSSLYSAWQQFRNLADVAFVLIFMVLIFSTSLSINISAYQLKTLLPKLIAAAILVQLSYFITSFAVDIGNVLGAGVTAIFNGIAAGTPGAAGSGAGLGSANGILTVVIAASGAIIAYFVIGLPFILLTLFGLFISILGVFVTLAARQLIVAILVITSPLAFAAWVLPNTESYFKLWYKNLARIILLYPLIVTILSAGGIVAKAAQGTGAVGPSTQINTILASIIPIIAFLSIPATFKMAGSIYANVSNRLLQPSRAARSRLRNSQLAKDMRAQQREKGFINQRDIHGTDLGSRMSRGIAKFQAGQYGRRASEPTMRRLARGYNEAHTAQMNDWGDLFDAQQWGNADLMDRVVLPGVGASLKYTGVDGREKTRPITKAMQSQAVAQIAKQGGNLELARIYDKIFDQNGDNFRGSFKEYKGMPVSEVTDMWFRGLGASGAMSSVIAAIPSTNPGKKAAAFDTLSASQIASMHGSASPFFFKRVIAPVEPNAQEQALGKTVGSLRSERVDRLLTSLLQISKSPSLAGKVDQQLMKRFRDAVTEGSMDIDPITGVATPMYDEDFRNLAHGQIISGMAGDEFLRRFITPNGKVVPGGIDEDEE